MGESRPVKIIQLSSRLVRSFMSLHVWQLLLVMIPLVFISATLLRMNNLGMVERRSAVLTADEGGNPDTVKRALADLQSYVSAHMNTDMGNGLYLQTSYNRAYDAALTVASDSSTNPSSAVYQQASLDCRSRFQGGVESFRNDYVQCVVERVSQLAPEAETKANLPTADNYRFDYVSPVWSPDFAGLFVALSVLTGLLIIIRIFSYGVFRALVGRYYKRA